jgi:hypothetical protein
MVAYNFKKQFASKVESLEKRQTIRALGKRRHAQPGDDLQLYTGQRTKACKKLLDAICYEVIPIRMQKVDVHVDSSYVCPIGCIRIDVDGQIIEPMEVHELAKTDGFESPEKFLAFFADRLPFEGVIIKW